MSDNQFFTILTETGRRKFRDAMAGGGCIELCEIAVGDGGGQPVSPAAGMTGLVNEVYRAPITHNTPDPVNTAWAILNLVIPIETGGWYVREAGVYDTDGDLIFVGSLPATFKPLPSMGVASDLSINLIIDVERAETVTITVDPSTVLASQAWVRDEIAASRMVLSADISLYVRTDGDDGNDGLSEQTALATFGGLIDRINLIDPANHRILVDIGEGEFSATNARQVRDFPEGCVRLIGKGTDKTFLTDSYSMNLSCYVSGICFNVLYIASKGIVRVRGRDGESGAIRVGGPGESSFVSLLAPYGKFYLEQGSTLEIAARHLKALDGTLDAVIYPREDGYVSINGAIRFVEPVAASRFVNSHSARVLFGTAATFENADLFTGVTGRCTQGGRVDIANNAVFEAMPGDGVFERLNSRAIGCQQGSAIAWAQVTATGELTSAYNVATVHKTGTGGYTVVFASPSRDARLCPVATSLGDCTTHITEVTTRQCTVITRNQGVAADGAFSLAVLS